MSGRHRRPEADSLPAVDVAEEMTAGPVIDTTRSRIAAGAGDDRRDARDDGA